MSTCRHSLHRIVYQGPSSRRYYMRLDCVRAGTIRKWKSTIATTIISVINGDGLMTRDPNTHCGIRYTDRRQFLWQFGGGLGGIALASLLNQEGLLAAPHGMPHFAPKAKRVVQLFMSGAASQCDTFDY